MLKYLQFAPVRSLLLTAALALTLAGSMFAQDFAPWKPARGGPRPADLAETASSDALPSAPTPSTHVEMPAMPAAMAPVAMVIVEPKPLARHRFWDRENSVLFATVGGFATADFFTTRANLASGGKELNPVTRVFAGSTPALAANFALETGSVMAISYFFHKTGHHQLERITSFVNIGASAGAVGYSLAHR